MTKQDTLPQYSISQTALVSIIGQVISGYPNPDDPEQFGPWWVIIRRALQQVLWRSGPQLDPWIQVELNPQPLPPRTLFFTAIAQEVVERAALISGDRRCLTKPGRTAGYHYHRRLYLQVCR